MRAGRLTNRRWKEILTPVSPIPPGRSIPGITMNSRHRDWLVRFTPVLLAIGPAVWLTCCGPKAAGADKPRVPNVIMILADDLGYGDLGCYGQKQIRTAHLDRMAAEGLRFTQCYAGSTVCAPSRCVLMTGMHTGHSTIRGNGLVPLRRTDLTVAEL